jgi:hypothetical protein
MIVYPTFMQFFSDITLCGHVSNVITSPFIYTYPKFVEQRKLLFYLTWRTNSEIRVTSVAWDLRVLGERNILRVGVGREGMDLEGYIRGRGDGLKEEQ